MIAQINIGTRARPSLVTITTDDQPPHKITTVIAVEPAACCPSCGADLAEVAEFCTDRNDLRGGVACGSCENFMPWARS